MYKNEESPEVLACLEEVVNGSLTKHGFSVQVAAEITSDVISKVTEMLGGEQVYFPAVLPPPHRTKRKKKVIAASGEILSSLEKAMNDSLTKHVFPVADKNRVVSDAVSEFGKRYSGEKIYFPKNIVSNRAKRNKEILEALDSGVSPRALARKYRLSERRIGQISSDRYS
ncbi:MAG: hypothetical protein A2W80_12920 [Candidatus Riflebacteria bacterium GWC2_50_8]|nr:MAG: hypothetical protein A2W80_12920 [Candidatus Riflebacteria bacterium GWC2_50_8]